MRFRLAALAIVITVPCAAQPAAFTEEAELRGIQHAFEGNAGFLSFGRGVAFADLDGDRDPDLVALGGVGGIVGLYENIDGSFASRTAVAGLPVMPDASSVVAGDYDGDGDLDLYIGCWLEPNALLRNDGGFSFVNVAGTAGVADAGAATGCAWADYDGDGWLDLYVANRTLTADSQIPNRLYRNEGDGTFTEVGADLGVDDGLSPTFQAIFLDMDRDGDPDLYLSTDKGYGLGEQNRLFENTAGTFVDVTDASQTAAYIDSMGVAVGDVDRNLLQDLYCTNTPPGNVLFLNQGEGLFEDASAAAGVECNDIGWGTAFVDYDNDGWLELYVCNVSLIFPNRLYEHDGVWPAVDVAPALGVDDDETSYVMAVADIEGDGDVDLLVQDTDRLRLFVNHEGERRSWIRLDVETPAPQPFGIGTTVDLRTGATWQTDAVAAGGGYKSQNELTLHFGLGDATAADEIAAVFPDGTRRTLTGYPGCVAWRLVHPTLLLDDDGDGDVDWDDAERMRECLGTITPGCELMDGDGSGVVDADDAALLVFAFDGQLHDCDDSGTLDLMELILDPALDANGNWIIDGCEAVGDVDGNGVVDVDDLLIVILGWGPCSTTCVGDTDGSGVVDVDDLVTVILNWS